MPTDKHVTVYVDLQNVDEVKSLMQDAATQIGALRAAGEALAESLRESPSPGPAAAVRRWEALSRWDVLTAQSDGYRDHSEAETTNND